MVGWHHRLNGLEVEQAPGGGEGQGSLACCSSWGRKESDTTERLNWTCNTRVLASERGSEHSRGCRHDVVSFSLHNSCAGGVTVPDFYHTHFYAWRNWSSERFSGQWKVTHSTILGGAAMHTQYLLVHVLFLSSTHSLSLNHQQRLMRLAALCPLCRWKNCVPESQTT